MSKQTIKPLNVKALLNNLNLVMKTRNIDKLNKPTYTQVSLMSGFIAHYNLYGFRDTYRCIGDLICDLANSADFRDAERYIRDPWFAEEYGTDYCQSKVDFYNGIVKIVAIYNN